MTRCKCGACDCNVIHEDNVALAQKDMLEEDLLLDMADFYKALSDSTRLKIINLLCRHELCVCDISAILNMTKSAVSHQLQNLKEMKLIKGRKSGKEVWYSLDDSHVLQVFKLCKTHILEAKK